MRRAPLVLVCALLAAAPAAPAQAAARPLAGIRVVLDPGHDGGNASHPSVINRPVDAGGFRKPCNTTGTSTNHGYAEHAFTFAVARTLAARLRALGATVVLTRTTDTGVGPCVDRRARIANAAHPDVVVSIHADGAPGRDRGFHVIEPGLAPDKGNRAILTSSDRLARDLRAAVLAEGPLPAARYPGGIITPGLARRTDLAGLDLSRYPVALIECGNMRNATDASVQSSAEGRSEIADGILAGIEAFVRRG
ncbi:N-acetylmuramoyl-L-alanine amidase [Motilibacter rhizosphaerae]|uniref:N-acetylmuramoyl-L-alanine amidase n=1 Tax=Motilibacter rhizosphaerae TaxID=598652 RepID=A0A4Q7NB40_9ACTN|nr:N-acetylmuramoyl-L-alanine amidase [Motilibacter rhizosphaerae]RZS80030.1 N-acetylmuramoyl-L-alanine amidase [Motilibacter rhizosphaerae]